MAAKKKTAGKRKPGTKRARGRLAPRGQSRGLDASAIALVALVRSSGGAPIGAYHEPLGARAMLLASLPLGAIQKAHNLRDRSLEVIRMAAAAKTFKLDSISHSDLAWVAVGAGGPE